MRKHQLNYCWNFFIKYCVICRNVENSLRYSSLSVDLEAILCLKGSLEIICSCTGETGSSLTAVCGSEHKPAILVGAGYR
jgi:hypothetical protein